MNVNERVRTRARALARAARALADLRRQSQSKHARCPGCRSIGPLCGFALLSAARSADDDRMTLIRRSIFQQAPVNHLHAIAAVLHCACFLLLPLLLCTITCPAQRASPRLITPSALCSAQHSLAWCLAAAPQLFCIILFVCCRTMVSGMVSVLCTTLIIMASLLPQLFCIILFVSGATLFGIILAQVSRISLSCACACVSISISIYIYLYLYLSIDRYLYLSLSLSLSLIYVCIYTAQLNEILLTSTRER